jgi:CMP/dCMP kinase
MTAVTISRQYGSLGCEIAQMTGQKLGFRVIYRELINQAAVDCGSPDIALAVIDELGLFGLTPTHKEFEAYRRNLDCVMNTLVDDGKVIIIGRAGQSILRERKDVLHVRIIAPLDVRVIRIASRQEISKEAAFAQIKASDHSRKQFLKRLFKVSWDDPSLYHLVLNTGFLNSEAASDLISMAAANLHSIERDYKVEEDKIP